MREGGYKKSHCNGQTSSRLMFSFQSVKMYINKVVHSCQSKPASFVETIILHSPLPQRVEKLMVSSTLARGKDFFFSGQTWYNTIQVWCNRTMRGHQRQPRLLNLPFAKDVYYTTIRYTAAPPAGHAANHRLCCISRSVKKNYSGINHLCKETHRSEFACLMSISTNLMPAKAFLLQFPPAALPAPYPTVGGVPNLLLSPKQKPGWEQKHC